MPENMEMKERPILFSGPMVQAILDGRKTQTRRPVKWPVTLKDRSKWLSYMDEGSIGSSGMYNKNEAPLIPLCCPYGKVGDRLWVRETHSTVSVPRGTTANTFLTVYRADNPQGMLVPNKWKPSIFMRRHDSRITLEITGVRVERLNEISGDDAKAEGKESIDELKRSWNSLYKGQPDKQWLENQNGTAAPWVWVVEFKKI